MTEHCVKSKSYPPPFKHSGTFFCLGDLVTSAMLLLCKTAIGQNLLDVRVRHASAVILLLLFSKVNLEKCVTSAFEDKAVNLKLWRRHNDHVSTLV